jgi:hypothetical protein
MEILEKCLKIVSVFWKFQKVFLKIAFEKRPLLVISMSPYFEKKKRNFKVAFTEGESLRSVALTNKVSDQEGV